MERFELEVPTEFEPRINAAPSESLPVIRTLDGTKEISLLRWGLIPFWAKEKKVGYRMINARSETADSKPSFRQAFEKRRCLVIVDGFYEWVTIEKKKWPIWITFGEPALQVFAGLWERWTDPENGEPLETYSILTTDADPVLAPIHDRMPLFVPQDFWTPWLEGADPKNMVSKIRAAFPAEKVSFHPVNPQLNRAGQEDRAWLDEVELPGNPDFLSS